ncbi:tetratricopeptide repeat protein [Roseomonas sp. 18066]|uniref:tetratricopeptide repeat protein n=1 Tax=Roseomonas sp. 18066 TaxID=2681412 RepID=UPI001359280F|nr:tetratricopeptide repeat protein [Roseomonas sp. 18066]
MREICWLLLLVPLLAACNAPRAGDPPKLSPAARLRLLEAQFPEGGQGADYLLVRSMVAASPDDAALQDRLALAAGQAGQPAEALAAQERAIALAGPSPERLLVRGRLALLAGQVPLAQHSFQSVLAADPAHVQAMTGLAVCHDMAGDPAQALTWHQAALQAAPTDWSVRVNYGMSRLLAAQPAEAARLLAAAERDPSAPRRARHNLALALAAQNNAVQAETVLSRDMAPPEARALVVAFTQWAAQQTAQRGQP